MCIVKADAYGHGAQFVARELDFCGADWFGVSNIEEALHLRKNGIKKPVLILGYTPEDKVGALAEYELTQAVFSLAYVERLNSEARKLGVKLDVHIKIDTGMGRIGFVCCDGQSGRESVESIASLSKLGSINATGIFTHFSSADVQSGDGYTKEQFERFNGLIGELECRGITFELKHCANSAAIFTHPETHMDLVRPGIVLYGLCPSDDVSVPELKPAMELKTVISQLKTVPKGTPVSYGRTYETSGESVLATVPIGYADGYNRVLSNRAHMIVNKTLCPVAGRVCMDMTVIDVSGVPDVKEGMTVTVFGSEHGVSVPIDEIARMTGTINYETVCDIGKRVPRIYMQSGRETGQLNYILP